MLKAPLSAVHSHLQSINHSASSASGELLKADPKNATLSIQQMTQKARGQASLLAKTQVFGENNANLVGDIMPLYENGNPTLHSHADTMLNILANQFHDTIESEGVKKSITKLDIKKAITLLYRQEGKELPGYIKNFNVSHVYEKSNEIEKFASQRVRWYLAPMIAINHMSTFFNYSQAPLTAIMKSMTQMSDPEIKQLVESSGIFGSQMHHILNSEIEARFGIISSKLGKPEVGVLWDKLFHNPGFNFVRNMQLRTAAVIGYHSALYWAEGAMKGDKRSIAELKELGLNVGDILKRGGQLTTEEKSQAMFYFTNNRAFIDRTMDRSLLATKNPWTRMLTMFHGYVTFQQAFMRRELQKMLDSGDYVGIARYAGTVGLLFPTVAPMLKSAELLARTASLKQASQSLEDDYKKLSNPGETAQFTGEYLDLLSYFGSWGTMHSFLNAAHGDRLALALMGPIAGSAVRTGQDVINYATKPAKGGRRNIKPLAKDVLQQTIPGAGSIIGNQLFPPKDTTN
jgi:hypothetical protein